MWENDSDCIVWDTTWRDRKMDPQSLHTDMGLLATLEDYIVYLTVNLGSLPVKTFHDTIAKVYQYYSPPDYLDS